MLTIVRQEKTHTTHSSQWELWTEGDKYISVIYKYGILTATLVDDEEKKDILLTCQQIGDFYDSNMTLEELKEYTKDIFIWKTPCNENK